MVTVSTSSLAQSRPAGLVLAHGMPARIVKRGHMASFKVDIRPTLAHFRLSQCHLERQLPSIDRIYGWLTAPQSELPV